jgi:hypothetical protein
MAVPARNGPGAQRRCTAKVWSKTVSTPVALLVFLLCSELRCLAAPTVVRHDIVNMTPGANAVIGVIFGFQNTWTSPLWNEIAIGMQLAREDIDAAGILPGHPLSFQTADSKRDADVTLFEVGVRKPRSRGRGASLIPTPRRLTMAFRAVNPHDCSDERPQR